MVVYTGKRKIKDLVKFVDKEMKKAKKDRVKVNGSTLFKRAVIFFCDTVRHCLFFQEDEDRRKYIETLKAEEINKNNQTKDEL